MTVGAALLRQLYGAPPDGFTAARDAAVAEARARGDTAAAKEIAALRKPTVAAWLVNLLAIRRPELLADLAALAGEMRAAQRDLRGAELRELSAQRRRVVASLVAEVRALAAGSGAEPGRLPLGEVEDTLNAALSDEEIAASVRSGRLLRPVTYAGFGEVPRPRLRLVTADADATALTATDADAVTDADADGTDRPATKAGPAEKSDSAEESDSAGKSGSGSAAKPDPAAARRARAAEQARRALERADREALRGREQAERDLGAAEEAERAAVAAVTELTARIAALRAERAEAEQEAGRRKLARKTAERAATAARRRHGDAAAALEATDGPFVEPAAPFADTAARKAAARRARADRGGAPKAESGA